MNILFFRPCNNSSNCILIYKGDSTEPLRIKIITTKVLKDSSSKNDDSSNAGDPDRVLEYITIDKKPMFKVTCFDGSELGES